MSEQAHDQYEQALNRMFWQRNAKHPPEFQYQSHTSEQGCPATHDGYGCTLIAGHTCDHVAHGRLGYIHHRWNDAGELNMICTCGAKLPLTSQYSICDACMRAGDEDECDHDYDPDDDDDEVESQYEPEDYGYDENGGRL